MKRPSPRSIVAVALAVAIAAPLAACGVPSSGSFEAFNDDEFGFNQTSSTTTTSATDSSAPAPSTTVPETTSTIATEPVTLYFLAGNQATSVSIALARPASPQQVVSALVAGPPAGQVGTGLRTALARSVEPTATNARGGVVVDVPAGFFEGIPPADQRLAVAQIVLTLTDRGGIGTVQFTLDGAPLAVPKGTGASAQPGEAVYRDDYASLLATEQAPTATSPDLVTTSSALASLGGPPNSTGNP